MTIFPPSPKPRCAQGFGGDNSNTTKQIKKTTMDISAWTTIAVIYVILTVLQALALRAGQDEEPYD